MDESHPEPVVVIVLAAGGSSRMGQPKLVLPFGGMTVLGATLAAVCGSVADNIVVVLGHHADALRAAVPSGVQTVINPDPTRGNASSLAAGLAASPHAAAAVVILGDMPGVSPEVVDEVIAAWRGGACVAAVVEYADGPGHPLLIDGSLFGVVLALEGEGALWTLIDGLDRDVVRRVPVSSPKPTDVNRMEDYHRALRELD